MGNNIRKIISKNLSCKYGQELFDHVKQSATDAPKTSKISTSKFRANNRVGIIMIHGEHIIPIVELSLILQF